MSTANRPPRGPVWGPRGEENIEILDIVPHEFSVYNPLICPGDFLMLKCSCDQGHRMPSVINKNRRALDKRVVLCYNAMFE